MEAVGAGSLFPAESSSLIFTCYLAKFSKFDCFSIWAFGKWKAIQFCMVERGQERSVYWEDLDKLEGVEGRGDLWTDSSLSHLSEEEQGWSLLIDKPCLFLSCSGC